MSNSLTLREKKLLMAKVDLDALIPREDLAITGESIQGDEFDTIGIRDFNSFIPSLLRKPIFQRETNEWDAKMISTFVDSYLSGDLIPTLILWKSETGLVFVIDGAHRLSALLAWFHDDYGNGDKSNDFYLNNVSDESKTVHRATKKYIDDNLGSYAQILDASNNPNSPYSEKAKGLTKSIRIQWVRQGDIKVAEKSFFRINQQGVGLNTTETKLIQSRDKGNCIAARAISRSGGGYPYWYKFSSEVTNDIKSFAEQINNLMFEPPLKKSVNSIDYLPMAGKNMPSQSLPLILDFVNIANNIPHDFNKDIEKHEDKSKHKIKDDVSGQYCVQYLQRVRKIAQIINSNDVSSIGLHPIIYYYTLYAQHKPASFYAAIDWVMQMIHTNSFLKFLVVRPQFEEFLQKYDYLTQQINRTYRQAIRSYPHIKDFYVKCIESLYLGRDILETAIWISSLDDFNYLKLEQPHKSPITAADYTRDRKNKVKMIYDLKNPRICSLCGGLMHANATTVDHGLEKSKGGISTIENAGPSHGYCNSNKDNLLAAKAAFAEKTKLNHY